MANRYLFSVEAKHELVKLPHFGPFLTATEAGQAVDRLLARFEDLSVRIHAFTDADFTTDEVEDKHRLCTVQIDDACTEGSYLSVVEPIQVVAEMPSKQLAAQIAADNGLDPKDLGFFPSSNGYALFRVHMVTTDLSKAMTAARWRRRELAGASNAPEVAIMTMPIPTIS
ncbi:hypothetical protein N8H22_16175 [Stutzerimonas stutzeri]|uniref:hypothetical protein n=1 Tax=Stutzerimonas sp. S1 TaxID=3030652 RepID=UPI00222474D1|nr:hypothetical protein [Stutzerimonas sp. S1]MCW3150141.1 hypothetical protein [Stutzerimonas sp. S1]